MNKLQKEIFEMEEELGVPLKMRWHNTKQQKTLEEAAKKLYPEKWESVMEGQHDSNSYERNAFLLGVKSDVAKEYWTEQLKKN